MPLFQGWGIFIVFLLIWCLLLISLLIWVPCSITQEDKYYTFISFLFFFFCVRILDIFFKKLSRNISSICLENAGQSWGCLEYETLTGVPNVISFRAWNQAGILLLSQGPMPFLKKRTDLKFLQIRIYLVIGPLCMKESERKSLHGSLSHSHQNLRRKVSHLKVQWEKKRIL